MEQKKVLDTTARIVLPLLLGGAILWWMYRQFDFGNIRHVLLDEMDWTWMWLSFPFGITAMLFRGWRWQQTLEPLGEKPRSSVSINAVFLSYAASLVIPRIGEFTRCGVLKRYDGISFAKALGTVVTERAIDSLFILIITGLTILFQLSIFGTFFERTGTNIGSILHQFSGTGYLVTAICGIAALILLRVLLKRLSFPEGRPPPLAVPALHPRHLGQLLPALLPALLLLPFHGQPWAECRHGHLRRQLHRRRRAHP